MKKYLLVGAFLSLFSGTAQINSVSKTNVKGLTQKGGEGYYRVVAKGFICNRETVDDMLERDGKRDEIYLSASAVLVDANGVSMPSTAIKTRTRTMGDVNGRAPEERRCMAGSAVGNLGGIRTGDNVPDVEPWKNNAPASADLLPYVLWEGDLSGGKSVMITPMVMEYDGPDDFLTNMWHNSFVGTILKAPIAFATLPYKMFTSMNLNGPAYTFSSYDDSTPGVFPAPTVIQQFSSQFFRVNVDLLSSEERNQFLNENRVVTDKPADRPIGSLSGFYSPLVLKLTAYDLYELSGKDFGYGMGIIPIRFKDTSGLNGDYTVFYAFERISDTMLRGKINVTNNDVFDPVAGYKLRNVNASDMLIDVLNGGRTNNTHLVLNTDKNLDSEKFRIRKANDYYFNLTNMYNNLNIDILNKNDINGSNIVTSSADGSETQQWAFIRYCDGSWLLRNVKTKRMMEVYNAAVHVIAPLGQWDFTNAKNQRWFIEK